MSNGHQKDRENQKLRNFARALLDISQVPEALLVGVSYLDIEEETKFVVDPIYYKGFIAMHRRILESKPGKLAIENIGLKMKAVSFWVDDPFHKP